ncbi:protein late bloomer-like [Teleopsis dalmanni]|uniref:protein late bloomer-like n=1 Tax=Teleopsis dalmanni TaxID=139649 RepID=UPI0018CFCFE5|nr:protein late bloomer-like [Teleopsis dalmanni]
MASARVCLQWTLILFNTFSVIIGILAIVAGVYELEKFTDGSAEHTEKIVQLAAASVLVISAFIGCCGAVNGSIKILCLFIVILVGLIASHIWKLWRYDEGKQLTATEMLVTYTWIAELVKPGAMIEMQATYECCGKKSYVDYTSLGLELPRSCFRVQNGMRAVYPFGEGCMSAVKKAYLTIYRYERLAHWSLIGFEVLGILLSIILICKLTAKTRRYRY